MFHLHRTPRVRTDAQGDRLETNSSRSCETTTGLYPVLKMRHVGTTLGTKKPKKLLNSPIKPHTRPIPNFRLLKIAKLKSKPNLTRTSRLPLMFRYVAIDVSG